MRLDLNQSAFMELDVHNMNKVQAVTPRCAGRAPASTGCG